jgi:hypothetical protein
MDIAQILTGLGIWQGPVIILSISLLTTIILGIVNFSLETKKYTLNYKTELRQSQQTLQLKAYENISSILALIEQEKESSEYGKIVSNETTILLNKKLTKLKKLISTLEVIGNKQVLQLYKSFYEEVDVIINKDVLLSNRSNYIRLKTFRRKIIKKLRSDMRVFNLLSPKLAIFFNQFLNVSPILVIGTIVASLMVFPWQVVASVSLIVLITPFILLLIAEILWEDINWRISEFTNKRNEQKDKLS